jgi:hypothetical protein
MSARIRRYPKQSPTLKFGCVGNGKSYTKLRIAFYINFQPAAPKMKGGG